MTRKREISKKIGAFSLWFLFLSTFGVGGGIFFLLFAVVPIEQAYTDRGWSQFKIDQVMKYYVFGWVLFGFIISFIYYHVFIKKNRWKPAISLGFLSVFLCMFALYFFLNTGMSVVQSSQGTVEEGEQFTFGPYPEADDIKSLKEQGYDGIITLLNPTLPIEKPLLDKEKRAGEEHGIDIHSFPMLPWVGDNTKAIEEIKQLISSGDKKYYVHCYLGRHRVDVVKQVINEETGLQYDVSFLQKMNFERGNVYLLKKEEVLIGPFPTEEEWFTKIKRAEVKEVISLLPTASKWKEKEAEMTQELDIHVTSFPIDEEIRKEEIDQIADYINKQEHPVYIHRFFNDYILHMMEAQISWGKTILLNKEIVNNPSIFPIGAKLLIGPTLDDRNRKQLQNLGVEQFIRMEDEDPHQLYEAITQIKQNEQLSYIAFQEEKQRAHLERIALGLFYGSDPAQRLQEKKLHRGNSMVHDRNLLVGPIWKKEEFSSFGQKNGVAQIIFLYSPSVTETEEVNALKEQAKLHQIPFQMIDMKGEFQEELIQAIEKETGLNYIMVERSLVDYVNELIEEL